MYAVLRDDDSRTRCRKTAQRREKKKRSGLSRALKPKLSYFRQENHMLYLGCHLSISKGYHKAAQEAVSIGANTFQFFTRNPRGGNAKALDEKDIARAEIADGRVRIRTSSGACAVYDESLLRQRRCERVRSDRF